MCLPGINTVLKEAGTSPNSGTQAYTLFPLDWPGAAWDVGFLQWLHNWFVIDLTSPGISTVSTELLSVVVYTHLFTHDLNRLKAPIYAVYSPLFALIEKYFCG